MTPLSLEGLWGSTVPPGAVGSTLVWIFLAAHVLADFLFQTDGVFQGRLDGQARAYLVHGLTHLVLSWALSVAAWSPGVLLAGVIVAAVHVAVDVAKDGLLRARARLDRGAPAGGAAGAWAFVADQLVHVWVIVFVVALIPPGFLRPWTGADLLLRFVAGASAARVLAHEEAWRLAAVYLAVVLGGAVLVRLVLQAARTVPAGTGFTATGERQVPRTGTYVGMVERALILSFLLLGSHAAVGFVIAAKSIARFRELEDRAFAEYYLVGTLLSVLVALGGYLVLRPAG
ncbi:DUF3307 domain-containing protein [Carboxydochorda subterranea]|uniref:DUF3307 domain-containing protein n=1 Tax=Carboxydichorda subterranea TaxID=3109565 RepID=A0ABZ1BU61_9FIRM|nr:DUF3307 domain-containing protein [Limnochorda sp. L945t]WRP16128.1 DUF3307 domain-containing protein [Limnochorda sp. L945t]